MGIDNSGNDSCYVQDKAAVRASFSKASATYDEAAVLQAEINDRMISRLQFLKNNPKSIADLGCGTGYAYDGLIKHYPNAQYYGIDFSNSMLKAFQHRIQRQRPAWQFWKSKPSIQYIEADLECLPLADESVGMIWCSFALQWLNNPQGALREIFRVLEKGGVLMLSTFTTNTLKELREVFRVIDDYPHVSRFLSMHDMGNMLMSCNFSNPVIDVENMTMTYSNVKELMLDLKNMGARNSAIGRYRGLFGRKQWAMLMSAYEQFRVEGRLPATWEIMYVHACKLEASDFSDQIVRFYPKPI